jgi:hypothetical protein
MKAGSKQDEEAHKLDTRAVFCCEGKQKVLETKGKLKNDSPL